MSEDTKEWGIALAGGGTKGSYHIGAWRAIRELGIDISAVCGTSIGAVNGALVACGDYEAAERIWNSVEMTDIISLSEEAKEGKNLFHLKNAVQIATDIYKNKGIDFTPFERMLTNIIDEDKLRLSPVDYGLVTFNLSEGRSIQVFKSDIPEGRLCEYMVASASFPGFKPKVIDGSVFMDGGVTNNMPIDMLVEKGVDNIIAINVGGIGIVKSANVSGKNLIKISPTENVVGIMDFNEDAIGTNILQGYYDTLKAFGKYVGDIYFFNTADYYRARSVYSEELLSGLETAGKILGIDRFKSYDIDEFIRQVIVSYNNQNNEFDKDTFKFKNEKNILCAVANAILRGNTDILNNRIVSGLGVAVFEGARSVAYFLKAQ